MNGVETARMPEHQETSGGSLTGLVDKGMLAFDALLEYFGAILTLQGYRFAQTTVRPAVMVVAAYASAAALALSGLTLLTLGLVFWIADRLESLSAGFAIVGAFYVLAGIGAALILLWRAKRSAVPASGQQQKP
jgi:hypothetical protein